MDAFGYGPRFYPESALPHPETINLLLEQIDAKLGEIEPISREVPHGYFAGNFSGDRIRFRFQQVPVEVSGNFFGAIARVEVTPLSPIDGEVENQATTEFRFLPTLNGVKVEKILPFERGYVYEEVHKDNPDMVDEELDAEVNRMEESIRAEERGHGLTLVDDKTAKELLTAIKESEEDIPRNEFVKRQLRDSEKNMRRVYKNLGLPNEPWIRYTGKRILRRVLGKR